MPVDETNPHPVSIEPFEPARHERAEFACGVARLDNFLRLSARKQQKDHFTRRWDPWALGRAGHGRFDYGF